MIPEVFWQLLQKFRGLRESLENALGRQAFYVCMMRKLLLVFLLLMKLYKPYNPYKALDYKALVQKCGAQMAFEGPKTQPFMATPCKPI